MIDALKALFVVPPKESEQEQANRLHMAAAALLIETSRADFEQGAEEEQAMQALLRDSLSLTAEEVQTLMTAASERVDNATSLYEFTRTINDHYSADQKYRLVEAMWRVAYADGDLDKYEEALIRQVADLTYVPHEDYIRCKLKVRDAAARGKS